MTVIEDVELRMDQGQLENTFADAIAIPLDTLDDWLLRELDTWQRPHRPEARAEKHPLPAAQSQSGVRLSYLFAKRCLDIVGSLAAIVMFSPVMLLAAILIKFSDWGPVVYCQKRVGLDGAEFLCFKFRSMVVDADKSQADLECWNSHDDSRTFKIPNDPRVTWIGRILRRSSFDELPQLFNILLGSMSLVGPRPPVPHEVEQYTPDDMRRLAVKPGLTGLWQVSGRSRLPFPEQLRLDLQYVEQCSLWLDLKLLLRTIPAVVSADGAY